MKVLCVYPNINGFHDDSYHFGLASIVSVVRDAGHEVRVMAVTKTEQYDEFVEEVDSFGPAVIGFSSVSSQFGFVRDMAFLVKKTSPSILTVCGGVHPTIYPDALLDSEMLDAFFVGESEHSFLEFIEKVEAGEPYLDSDNLAYVKDGLVTRNKMKPLVENLDELPHPDKEIFPYEKTVKDLGYAPFFFTRGCPYVCTYCSNQALADIYERARNFPRFRTPESCVSEIEEVIEKYDEHIDYVYIGDDIFGLNTEWRQEFCALYKARVKKKFRILLRVEMINDTLLTMLKDAGCFKIFFGVESGNEEMRREVMQRKMSNKTIIDAFDLCRKYGIETLAVNIIGMPGETEEMIWDTIKLNRRLRPSVSGVNIFYPYLGTELGDKCFEEGLVDADKFPTFSNERRESCLNYPGEYKQMLSYYYDNWDILVYPYNPKLRAKQVLKMFWLLGTAQKTKRMLSAQAARFGVGQASDGFRPGAAS
jgi:radical SAM superfamily enzyme YgiQ (UPF0313 family)